MNVLNKLNGWQRVWFVITCLLLVAAVIGAFNRATFYYDYSIVSDFEKPECKHVATLPYGYILDRDIKRNEECYDLYIYRQLNRSAADSGAEYIEQANDSYRKILQENLLNFSIIALFVSGMLYLLGIVINWMKKGFER